MQFVLSSLAISTISRVVSDLDTFRDGRIISLDTLDAWYISLELVFRELVVQQTFNASD